MAEVFINIKTTKELLRQLNKFIVQDKIADAVVHDFDPIDFKNHLIHIVSTRGLVDREVCEKLFDEQGIRHMTVAFTHPTMCIQSSEVQNSYEVYKILGDSGFSKCLIWYLVRRFPALKQGQGDAIITEQKKQIIERNVYAQRFDQLELERFIRYKELIYYPKSKNEESKEMKVQVDSIMKKDVFEAFISSLEDLIDCRIMPGAGQSVIYNILASLWDNEVVFSNLSLKLVDLTDPHSKLNEIFAERRNDKIEFERVDADNITKLILSFSGLSKPGPSVPLVKEFVSVPSPKKIAEANVSSQALEWLSANYNIQPKIRRDKQFKQQFSEEQLKRAIVHDIDMDQFRKELIALVTKKGSMKPEICEQLFDERGINHMKVAFTHYSMCIGTDEKSYELYELMGDVTTNKSMLWYFIRRIPTIRYGNIGDDILTALKKEYLKKEIYAKRLEELNLVKFIRYKELSYTEAGKQKTVYLDNSMKEDVFEAFFAALEELIDSRFMINTGYSVVYNIITSLMDGETYIPTTLEELTDPKTKLQEIIAQQKTLHKTDESIVNDIKYENRKQGNGIVSVLKVTVNNNQKTFTGEYAGKAQISEFSAAEQALEWLNKEYKLQWKTKADKDVCH